MSSISDRNRYSRLTMTKPDPHNQRRAKSCRLLYVPDRQHDFAIYRQICSQQEKLQIRPTDVAGSNIPSSYAICFSVYIFTALGAPFPPSPHPARLSQRYTQPFIARETISIQKMLRWLHCGMGGRSGERREERRDVTISTALPQL